MYLFLSKTVQATRLARQNQRIIITVKNNACGIQSVSRRSKEEEKNQHKRTLFDEELATLRRVGGPTEFACDRRDGQRRRERVQQLLQRDKSHAINHRRRRLFDVVRQKKKMSFQN